MYKNRRRTDVSTFTFRCAKLFFPQWKCAELHVQSLEAERTFLHLLAFRERISEAVLDFDEQQIHLYGQAASESAEVETTRQHERSILVTNME